MVVNEEFIKRPDVYNCMVGGQGGDSWTKLGHRHSEETKKKISEHSKEALKRPNVRKKISQSQKEAWKRIKANKEFYDDIQHRRSENAKLACKNRKQHSQTTESRQKISQTLLAYYDKVGRKRPKRITQPYKIKGLKSKPTTYVTNGQYEFRIRKEEIKTYLQHGYWLGRNPNNKKPLASNQIMKDNSSDKGKVIIHNDELQQLRRINPNELDEYLANGWKRGYLHKKSK